MSDASKDPSLAERLADALPAHLLFKFYHISTPPTKAPAIYSAPPGARPEKTYRESHFLNVSIGPSDSADAKEVLILAIEILIYSTRYLTTLFVSKADSTGYLSLLPLPKGHTSPLRTIASTFLEYLVEKRQRKDIKLVVSLFARASDQYLFPGSVENSSKHVSDDRQLVKWWCRVLDPVLRKHKGEDDGQKQENTDNVTSQAYLIVPGEDNILSFLPPDVRLNPALRKRWKHGHPLQELACNAALPPRCLVPHFPDDPKARFLVDLDDELPDGQSIQIQDSPSKRGNGKWRSVKTLEQFWEMMAFRQECSSGRLVGFIWIVFTPPSRETTTIVNEKQKSQASFKLSISSSDLKSSISTPQTSPSPERTQAHRRKVPYRHKKVLKGRIIPRTPKIKSASSKLSNLNVRAESKYYIWPPNSRGEIILSEKDYSKASEVLLRLDFANLGIATTSTKTWTEEVRMMAQKEGLWGQEVVGQKITNILPAVPQHSGMVNTLGVKRKSDVTEGENIGNGINMLGAGLVKKKGKVQPDAVCAAPSVETGDNNGVNLLGPRLVRKKQKIA